MASRLKFALSSLVILALFALAYYAPPDGHEHAVLAQFVGRFHMLVLHLPIALALLVAVLELAGLRQSWSFLRPAAGLILDLTAASAVVAAALGWLLAWSGGYSGALVTRHLWGGVCLAAAFLICANLRRPVGADRRYGLALTATLMLLVWTSHEGGALTHGQTYLTQYMPARMRRLLALPPIPAAKTGATTFYAARVQPILDDNCVTCHNPDKHKAGLLLDSYASLIKGGDHGAVIKPGDSKASKLFVRITLPTDDKHFMPSDGKRPLSAVEVKVIQLWIAAGASETQLVGAIKGAPAIESPPVIVVLAPDYRPRMDRIAALEKSLGVRLLPRSQIPTDGLVLRTASAPELCNDTALAQLKPVADLIVDAELARTRVTDAGMKSIATWPNLRQLDLSYTDVGAAGLSAFARVKKLESLNLTETRADEASLAKLQRIPTLKHVYSFGLRAK